jgi:hypothetical protein
MRWALKRQIFYTSTILFFVGIFLFLIIYPHVNVAPTCTDNRQNGTEEGVDCGGSCTNACQSRTDDLSILWSRAFKVLDGRYNAVAYLENHNKNAAVERISYRFRFADENNLYIGKRDGTTYIPPSGKFAIFEPAIDVGYSTPVYVTFEFTEAPHWSQVSQDKIDQLKIPVSEIVLADVDTFPRLSATIKNNSLYTIPEVTVVAILYDETGNAVSTSRTYLDELTPEEVSRINFTWPEPITAKVISKEIIPMFNIFEVKLR